MRKARRAAVAAVVSLAVTASAACGGKSQVQGDILISADRLFDGRALQEPGAVLVRGERIVAVGRSIDADAGRTIALGDATIMPGWIDLHVHAVEGLLQGGVTTVRDLGSPLAELHAPLRWRGLRWLGAGPFVSVEDGYPSWAHGYSIALNVRGPKDARKAIRTLVRRGAAVIKIGLDSNHGQWPLLTVAEVRAIVAEAHAHDRPVTAHALWPDGIRRALAGGVDEFAHVPCGATDEMLRQIAAQKIEVVATLHVMSLVNDGCGSVAARLVQLGVQLLYGSDVGNRGIPHGVDVEELRLMRATGLSSEQVLAAATSAAGKQLALAQLGTLVAGAPADVIAVRGDARELSDDLAAPLLVVAGGRIAVDRSRR